MELVSTSIILVTTSKKCAYEGMGGAAMLTWPRENTVSTSGVELKKR